MGRSDGNKTFLVFGLVLIYAGFLFNGVMSSSYQRPPAGKNHILRRLADESPDSPEQVHISVVGSDRMRIKWITLDTADPRVDYGTSSGQHTNSATGTTSTYRFLLYKSGQIHDVVIGPLNPNTVYYYICNSFTAREYSFKTPPAQLPIKFAISGDLGQTDWTRSTLQHIESYEHDMLLLPGDLSYANLIQNLWDSFGRLVEPLASKRPWMVTQGNHEVEKLPAIHTQGFTAYNARWNMPFEQSGSTSNLYYSFDVAGGSVHIIMLGSYADFDPQSDQYKWLQSDLAKIDRKTTSWVIAIVHAPWYNTNTAHRGEKESDSMKESMEDLLFKARVDVVFSGHVHAYERFSRVYKDKANNCGPMYINIGDGGNREGLATDYDDPKIAISQFREASFGHGRFELLNTSHAKWTWHRNDDNQAVAADFLSITSLASDSACKL